MSRRKPVNMGGGWDMSARLKVWTAAAVGLTCVLSACGSSGNGASSGGTSGSAGAPSNSPAGSGGSTSLTTIKIGTVPLGTASGFINMAQEKGYYKQCGVEVKVTQFASDTQLTPALVSGSIDMAIQSPDVLLTGTEKGVLNGKVIGSVEDGLPWAIYGGKGISSLKDLEGKPFAISTSTGLPAIVAQLILKAKGVDTSKIKWVNSGSNPDRFKAVVTGVVAGASSPSDYVPEAKKDGVNVLALASDVVPLYPRFAVVATDSFLKAHGDAATCYLASMIRGERYAFDHESEANALAAKYLGGSTKPDDPIITNMYQQIVQDKLINRDAAFPVDKLTYQEQALINVGLLKSKVPLDKVYDDQYQKAALKQVGGK